MQIIHCPRNGERAFAFLISPLCPMAWEGKNACQFLYTASCSVRIPALFRYLCMRQMDTLNRQVRWALRRLEAIFMSTPFATSAVLIALAVSFSIHAESLSQDNDVETMTVTGSRLAISTNELAGFRQVLTRADIERSQAQFLSDILPTLAGVDISNNGGTGQFSELRVRGGETNHIVVLLDGVQINDQAQGGLIDLAHIPLSSIERIELLQGTSGAQWGDGALSGVLSITTIEANSTSHAISVGAGLNHTIHANATQTIVADGYRHSVSVSSYDTEGQNISAVDGQTEEDGYYNYQVVYKPSYQLSDTSRLSGLVRFTEYRTQYDATDFVTTGLPIDANNFSKGTKQTFKLSYSSDLSQYVTVNAEYQNQRDDVKNTESGALSSASETDEMRYLAWVDINSNTLSLSSGAQLTEIDFEQSGPVGFGDPNQTQVISSEAFFADSAYRVNEDLALSASTRLTQNSAFGQSKDFTLGVSYQVSPTLRIFAQRGRASKNPTFTERFGFFAGTFQGNPNLEPEVAVNKEFGLAWNADNASIQLSIFDTVLDNEINGFVFDANTGGFTADNIAGKSTRQGWQVQSNWQFDTWDLAVNYAYTDASDSSATELRRARHNGSITANFALASAFDMQVQAIYQGTQLDQFFPPWPQPSEIVNLEAYWLFNLGLGYAIDQHHSVGFNAKNLFDKAYQDIVGYRGKERMLELNYRYQW